MKYLPLLGLIVLLAFFGLYIYDRGKMEKCFEKCKDDKDPGFPIVDQITHAHLITSEYASYLKSRPADGATSTGYFFSKVQIDAIIKFNPTGFRFYYGQDANGVFPLMVGTSTTAYNDEVDRIFKSNHQVVVPYADAQNYTKAFQDALPMDLNTIAGFFPREAIESVMGLGGIRVYLVKNNYNEVDVMVIGVRDENSQVNMGIIIDMSLPCPAHCGNNNKLNNQEARQQQQQQQDQTQQDSR